MHDSDHNKVTRGIQLTSDIALGPVATIRDLGKGIYDVADGIIHQDDKRIRDGLTDIAFAYIGEHGDLLKYLPDNIEKPVRQQVNRVLGRRQVRECHERRQTT